MFIDYLLQIPSNTARSGHAGASRSSIVHVHYYIFVLVVNARNSLDNVGAYRRAARQTVAVRYQQMSVNTCTTTP